MSGIWMRTRSWLRSVVGRRRLEKEVDEEILFHLESRAADLERGGMDARAALRQARLEFGGAATHKDDIRGALGLRRWDGIAGDLQYAVRILRKSPGFTLVAVSSLALAIGANISIFSAANEMLFERLKVPHPEQLRLLSLAGDLRIDFMSWGRTAPLPNGGEKHDSFTYPTYQLLRAHNHVLNEIFAFKDLGRVNATIEGNAQSANAELVSGNYYAQLQVQPVLGRPILPSDDGSPGTGTVVVISDGLWTRAFHRSPAVIGKVITINMTPMTIIGVNPKGFTGAVSVQQSPAFFMPLSVMPLMHAPLGDSGPLLSSTKLYWVNLAARARPGISDQEAQTALDVVVSAAERANRDFQNDQPIPHLLLEDGSRGLNLSAVLHAQPLHVLLIMVGGVLLMTSANMANLMLARSVVRQREMSVRLALGASRWRLLRQVLTESLLLSCMGGALGSLLGYLCRAVLPALLADPGSGDLQIPFNWRVLLFTMAITVGTGILFGVLPAWVGTRAEVSLTLKRSAHTATRRRQAWSGKAIVAFQVALSMILLVLASLFLRTLLKLTSIDPGFRTEHLILFDLEAPSNRYAGPKGVALHESVEDKLRSVPGVEGLTASELAFIAEAGIDTDFEVEGAEEGTVATTKISPNRANVGTDFFSVMNIPILAGRSFSRGDTASSQAVAVINQTLARTFFPHQNPIGKRFRPRGGPKKEQKAIQIVGVCADTYYSSLRDTPPPIYFGLYRQQAEQAALTYMVRTPLSAEAIMPSLRRAVRQIDPDLPLINVRTQDQQIDETLRQERTFAALTASFGLLALLLACVGLYGIMAYTVTQRTHEIGIRLALGARRGQVRGMVLREVGWLASLGVVAGLAGSLALGRLIRSMLYGLQPADPFSLSGAACVLLLVAFTAGWIPALRASNVEAMMALRHD